MSLTPSCGEIWAMESWNLAGAGWKTKCWDLLHKISFSVTKIKIPRVLKENVNTSSCSPQMYGVGRALENISGALQIQACSNNGVLFNSYVFRHFSSTVLRVVNEVPATLNSQYGEWFMSKLFYSAAHGVTSGYVWIWKQFFQLFSYKCLQHISTSCQVFCLSKPLDFLWSLSSLLPSNYWSPEKSERTSPVLRL